MNYLCLVYLDQENRNACSDSSCAAYAQSLHKRGKLLAGQPRSRHLVRLLLDPSKPRQESYDDIFKTVLQMPDDVEFISAEIFHKAVEGDKRIFTDGSGVPQQLTLLSKGLSCIKEAAVIFWLCPTGRYLEFIPVPPVLLP